MADGLLGRFFDVEQGPLRGFYPEQGLDEEERRLIEEMRAQGMYVPQERNIVPFGYGSGRNRAANLARMRAAIKPEQERRMKELMWQRGRAERGATAKELRQQQRRGTVSQQRTADKVSAMGEAGRQRRAIEEFNRAEDFKRQLIDKNMARRVAEEERRQLLGGLPTTSRADRFRKSTPFGEQPMISREDFMAGSTPQITDPQQAELSVLQRDITPALTQLEALKQSQQKTETQAIDVETKRRADDLARQVHALLPRDYAQMIVDKQTLGLELGNLLNTHRLSVSRRLGESLMQVEADASIATKKQEIMAIESLESWLVNTEPGREFMRRGGPQREEQRLKLGQLKVWLIQAEARKMEAEKSPTRYTGEEWLREQMDGRGGGTSSGSTGQTITFP